MDNRKHSAKAWHTRRNCRGLFAGSEWGVGEVRLIKEIYEFHAEMTGEALGRICLIMLLVVYVLISAMLFALFDKSFGKSEMMSGYVTGRHYHPPHVQVTSTGKTTVTTVMPASWSIDVMVYEIGETVNCSVSESVYDNSLNGSDAHISVSSGFFTSSYYCD